MSLKLVLAEDDYLIREGTASLLQDVEELELVATASDLPSLLKAVEEKRPDVVLTDIRMPPTNTTEGIDAAHKIRADHPQIGVLVLSQHAEDEYVHELFKNGSSGLGYLLKERVADIEDLVSALEEVARGGSRIDTKLVDVLVRRKVESPGSLISQLTARERETLGLMAQGKSNAAIAKTIFLSERAVEKHINSVFQKLLISEERDVNKRVLAVLVFLRETRLSE